MIRPAVPNDKVQVVELLRASHAGAGFDKADGLTGFSFPFDIDYAERLFASHLLLGRATAIVHDVDGIARGILMASAYEHKFGPVWLANETVWWIDPSHRGGSTAIRMLDAYESWAAKSGCKFAGMVGMGDDPNIAALYQRRGYTRAETHYLKAVL